MDEKKGRGPRIFRLHRNQKKMDLASDRRGQSSYHGSFE